MTAPLNYGSRRLVWLVRISVKEATCFGFKVATHRSAATLVVLGWVSGFFESSFE